jgi:hypothetical protein
MAKLGQAKPLKAKQVAVAFKCVAPVPLVNGDPCHIADMLDERNRARIKRLRRFVAAGHFHSQGELNVDCE